MGKINDALMLVSGILIFLIVYNFDQQISMFFKDIRFIPLDIILSILTNFGVVIVSMLVIPSIILNKKNKKLIYLLSVTSIVSFILALIVKLIVQRERPIDILSYPFTNIIDYSFPSQHSIVVFSLLPILIKYIRKQKYFWISSAFLIAFSRVYLGFHFLSDVMFGAFAGYFIGKYFLKLYEGGKLWKKSTLVCE